MELDELFRDEGHDMQWKEKARWIKFEEDVEEGSNRWGKPHVASLTFHSLIELRKRLAMGRFSSLALRSPAGHRGSAWYPWLSVSMPHGCYASPWR